MKTRAQMDLNRIVFLLVLCSINKVAQQHSIYTIIMSRISSLTTFISSVFTLSCCWCRRPLKTITRSI